nr:HAD superfamily phosphatase [uncultured bacterium]
MLAKPPGRKKRFQPDYIADSVNDINFKFLQKHGIKAVLIDLDGTVVSRGTYEVDAKLTNYLKKQTIKIYIATNRPKSRDLKNLKESLHATGVIHPVGIFMKPSSQYYKQAASLHHLKTSEVAMIGDKYLQDIYGANLVGLTTIVVRKLGEPKGFFDAQLSRIERKRTDKLAKHYTPVK